jgi:hypothetical protein
MMEVIMDRERFEARVKAAARWLMEDDTAYGAEPHNALRAAAEMLKAADTEENNMDREERRQFRSAAWKLLHAGFVTLSYDADGAERFTRVPETEFTKEESEQVYQVIYDAGVEGITSQEVADKLGWSVIKVRSICGDFPQ